jgi:hypothetical protein
MNRLFKTLRKIADRPQPADPQPEALPGFESRINVLCTYAERASGYEDDLTTQYDRIVDDLAKLQALMEQALDDYRDRDALEYLRLAIRLRPQRDLLETELRAFHVVADDLLERVDSIMNNIEEARQLAQSSEVNPAATYYLDQALTQLTRHFVNLERAAIARHRSLPERLAQQIVIVVDDRQLDLEMATFILNRRRALGSGPSSD